MFLKRGPDASRVDRQKVINKRYLMRETDNALEASHMNVFKEKSMASFEPSR